MLTPRQAIALAAFFNLFGAFLGTAVAKTIGSGQVDVHFVTMSTVLAALIGTIIWNLITWYFGIPSSSSHALIGGLCGAALATSHGDWAVLIWHAGSKGLWPQIIVPMLISPVAGMVIGFSLMALLTALLVKVRPAVINTVFGRLQVVSAAWMGLSHGSNDAQKTMGILALALFTGTTQGAFDHLPAWLGFLHTPTFEIQKWVVVTCALVMAAGTAAGGWRIIATMGHKMVRLQPIHGFAAETTAGAVISMASYLGIPLSTTHVISTSIMGVGAMKRFSAVKWGLVQRIVWAWVLTLPVTAALGWLSARFMMLLGVGK